MKTILILEDNACEMERLVKIVREQGPQNEVVCAVNLEQAYHMAMEKSVDLFLLDIILDPRTSGDASGMKFADHIREVERYHFTPIIFITGLEDPSLYAYSDVQCYSYVEKPYDVVQLAEIIKEALAIPTEPSDTNRMYYRREGMLWRLCKEDIVYIENRRSGRVIHTTTDERYLPYKPVKDILKELNSDDFVQCNRFVIVNRNHVETVDPVNRYITFKDRKDVVEIGMTYKKNFFEEDVLWLEIFLELFETLAYLYCFAATYGKKMKYNIYVVIFVVAQLFLMTGMNDYGFPKYLISLSYALMFTYCILNYKSSIVQAVINVVLSVLIMGIIQVLVYSILVTVFGTNNGTTGIALELGVMIFKLYYSISCGTQGSIKITF